MTTPDKDDPSVPRDSRFDAQWRGASREQPPPSLDATILAAARREVGAGPQRLDARTPSSAMRWTPFAIAATLGAVTFGVLQLVSTDRLVSPIAEKAVVTDMPPPATAPKDAYVSDTKPVGEAAAPLAKPAGEAAAPSTPAPTPNQPPPPSSRPPQPPAPQARTATPPPASSRADAMAGRPPPPTEEPHRRPLPVAEPAPEKRENARDDRAPALPQPFPSSPASSPASQSSTPPPSPAPAPQSFAPAPRTQESAAMPASAAPKTTGRLAEGNAIAALAKERATLAVPDWIALIRRLRAEGNADAAAKELAAFRTAHADHERLLPADLRDWQPPAQ